jgi:hypothetical protein
MTSDAHLRVRLRSAPGQAFLKYVVRAYLRNFPTIVASDIPQVKNARAGADAQNPPLYNGGDLGSRACPNCERAGKTQVEPKVLCINEH